ncbi:MAG: HEPN domain-containing protein [Thermodesulfobacteriota bacterium]|nr:HEPN domain-containing protein [Thermodesulfobacteriota bacterium]
MNSRTYQNGLKEFMDYQLPNIDQMLSENQEPLSKRPLAAALFFVNHCIIEIKGETKENFLEKEWFRSVYRLIKKWYEERYGYALKETSDYVALGIVLIYNTPFQLSIPLSISQEKEGTDKQWFCLPCSVIDDENVIDWIVKKPNIENMTKEELDGLQKSIVDLAENARSTHINLMTASLETNLQKISSTIQAHIDKAIQDILSLEPGRISTSYWEIHLAIEKAVKLIILQNGRDHQNKHDLDKLCKIANNIKGIKLDCNIFSGFPKDDEAIKQRYGEGSFYTIQEAVINITHASEVVPVITKLLDREFIMDNARVLIALPPWEK